MVAVFYGIVFAASLICAAIYLYVWHKHFDVNFSIFFTIVPVACLGYFLSSVSKSLSEAVFAQKIIYLGAIFLQLFMVMSIFHLCQMELSRWIRTALFVVCCLLYVPVLNIGFGKSFYKSVSFQMVDGRGVLTREYGIAHTFVYAAFLVFFFVGITVIFYTWLKKSQVPRTVLYLLDIPYGICIFTFFIIRKLVPQMDFEPLGYVLSEIVYLIIVFRINLYNVVDTVIDTMVQEQELGYVSFDFKRRFLGSNKTARRIIPDISKKAIDEPLGENASEKIISGYLDSFEQNESDACFTYTVHGGEGNTGDEQIFKVNVSFLYDGKKKRGYLLTLVDDTANRKYIRLLNDYNDKLKKEVEKKTSHIVQMHDNLVMSLAVMVESRDNSTGGHIKRTSRGVRILIEEIKRDGRLQLSDKFCSDIVKAAPMHDIGKIAVDDSVLRKPGKFTDEEYEQMKRHAAEGARVIHEILFQTDDEAFKTVAENIAHYHHERWDGRGYPEKLKGEQIPIEARIMAVADVYDALANKRVYKEAYDFDKADRIILEGMGTQFDPGLQEVYEKARPKLEAYYEKIREV